MPPLKQCLDCGKLSRGPRCPDHTRQRAARQTQAKREVRPYTYAEKERRAASVRAHVAEFGWVCPGYGVPAHPSTDLTADHPVAVAAGGSEAQVHVVMCRSCNSRKGARG